MDKTLIQQIKELAEQGNCAEKIARLLGISPSTIR
jgi:DNA-binding CsgD family transcriptional regulator